MRRGPVTIELDAAKGRAGLKIGDRVRIGSGAYAGEIAVIEKLTANGPIASATVRTEAGRTRMARTVDLTPVAANETGGAGQGDPEA